MRNKSFNRLISCFLVLVVLVGMIPTSANATEAETSVANGKTTVEGTNSFGALLAEDIQEQQASEETDCSSGYNVIGLTVENGVATVEYDTLEEAVLVVALYTEDGLQLLVSGNMVVEPDGTEAVITLEGEIPEYFMASAYLLDTYDYSPLCASYDTPMYTKEMQELLASTTDDYDADKILNLDDDNTTNFAVYADTTKVLEYTEGVNAVISADDETSTYVIGNADSNITGLQTGDVLAYAYGENQILIVKVASVTVDGTTATIIGDDLEMEEVFTHVKIENESTTSDFTVNESSLEEGVTFEGFVENGAVYAARPGDTTIDTSKSIAITLDKNVKTGGEAVELSTTLKGSLKLELETEFSYYVSSTRQFFEFKTEVSTSVSISLSGKMEIAIPLPSLSFSPVPGVGIGFTPEFKVEVSAKMEVSATWSATVGISYENGTGFQNLNTAPKAELDASVSGKIFIGLDLFPNANVLGGTIIEFGFSAPVGFELSAELTGTAHDNTEPDAESIHTCEDCLELELVFKLELTAELTILKLLSYEYKLITKEQKIGDLYYSLDRNEFAWGTCPYKSYRVTVYVKDSNNQNAVGTEVVAGCAEQLSEIPMGITNSNGVVVDYLQAGTYTFMATVDGENLGKTVTIEEACKVMLDKHSSGGAPTFISGVVDPDAITDYGKVIASGECGDENGAIFWTLYAGGLLDISGSGNMKDFKGEHIYSSSRKNSPWYNYRGQIKKIVMSDEITKIGDCAFENCSNVTIVKMPKKLVSIGDYAFNACLNLQSVSIPEGVSSVGSSAFYCCYDLSGIYVEEENAFYCSDESGVLFNKDQSKLIQAPGQLSGDYSIPECVTSIGNGAFYHCENIESIVIPDNVTTIGGGAFMHCTGLTSVEIGKGITTIGYQMFTGCGLTSITIPDNITSIGDEAFWSCKDLKSVVIGNGVKNIGYRAFLYCSDLTSISIGNGVTKIGKAAFDKCYSLKDIYLVDLKSWMSITYGDYLASPLYANDLEKNLYLNGEVIVDLVIPEGVSTFGEYAFSRCTSISSVSFPNSITSIGYRAFYGCTGLASLNIPNNIATIGSHAFYNCTGLTEVSIPDGVVNIKDGAFYDCINLTSLTIGNGVSNIGYSAFRNCSKLTSLTIPHSVTLIDGEAFRNCYGLKTVLIENGTQNIAYRSFYGCSGLTEIFIPNSVTNIGDNAFYSCSALSDVYYEGSESQWASITIGTNNTCLTNATIHCESIPSVFKKEVAAVSESVLALENNEQLDLATNQDAAMLFSIFDGEYSTEVTDTYTLKTAAFSGLVPGEQYILLALVSIEAEDILSPNNVLYIKQDIATEEGTLIFNYAQRENADLSYVIACGASHNNLQDAVIKFPAMVASEEAQAVHPVVVYNGKTLKEGVDYVVVGTVDYTSVGEYICYVRGIYNYSGLVQCQYTVLDTAPGDVDGDGEISDWDAIMLNRYLAGWSVEINLVTADVDGDGEASDWDAIILERYLAGWDVKLES